MQRTFTLFLSSVVFLAGCTSFVNDIRNEFGSDDDFITKSLWLDDFKDVCSGVPYAEGSEYTDEQGMHPIAVFDRDSKTDSYVNRKGYLPDAWESTFANPELTELVVCLTAEPQELVDSCEYDTDGTVYTLNTYNTNYNAELYSATTGELVDSTILAVEAKECPMIWYFYGIDDNYYPEYNQVLTDWVKPYVQK